MAKNDVTFHVFKSEEEWLKAREDTIGASGLAQFWITGEHPSPLPTDIPALTSALNFGSIWEPYIVQEFAKLEGLAIAKVNTPAEELKPNEIAWYDWSFYLNEKLGLHMSPDAVFRNSRGALCTLEVKTGSKPKLWEIEQSMMERYRIQAAVEARLLSARHAYIIYAPRPTGWEQMTAEQIQEDIQKSVAAKDILEVKLDSDNNLRAIKKMVDSMNDDSPVEESDLLREYVEAKEALKKATDTLTEYLVGHPDEKLHYGGMMARLVQKKNTKTDYEGFLSDHGFDQEALESYKDVTYKDGLSVTKEKK